jgi:hypothetical protein
MTAQRSRGGRRRWLVLRRTSCGCFDSGAAAQPVSRHATTSQESARTVAVRQQGGHEGPGLARGELVTCGLATGGSGEADSALTYMAK